MKTLALAMIVKNEERTLRRCLDSIKNIVDEMIIVDTGSTDDTKRIAIENGAVVYDFEWNNDFSAARNFSISKSSCDWIIVLDADEYIQTNQELIRAFIEKQDEAIGRINILSKYIDNGQEREMSSYVSRVFPNNGIVFQGKVHEQLTTKLPRHNIEVRVAHDGYFQTDKTERNLPLLLDELKSHPKDAYIFYQIAKQYYLKKDYLQANQYFLSSYSFMDANTFYKPEMIVDYLYSLIRSANFEIGLEIIDKEKKNLSQYTDFHFVCGIFYMELVFQDVNKYLKYFPLIEQSYIKCLEIGDQTATDHVVGTGSFLALYNLGVFYEVTGNLNKAIENYQKSLNYNYVLAQTRLEAISNSF